MTKEEFSNLSFEAQEEFINSGGEITTNLHLEPPASQKTDRVTFNTNAIRGLLSIDSKKEEVDSRLFSSVPPSSSDKVCDYPVTGAGQKEAQSGPQQESILPPNEVNDAEASPAESILYSEGFDIKDPVELLYILDDSISSGRVTLHDWQIQFMLDFAEGGQSDEHPFQAAMRAANGSGKDKYIIAACAVWICMRFRETLCPVTSSSGSQLDSQTCFHIKRLGEMANTKFGKAAGNSCDVWKLNYRYYECSPTRSYIKCYATDEPGKAEGFHPVDHKFKMAIFLSEDKTIPDEINVAVNKCTGYTHRVHASTPGAAMGHFYDICSGAIKRESIKSVNDVEPGQYVEYHIPASKCPHLAKFYFDQMKRDLPGGEFGAAYKSQVHAEFGQNNEMVVIQYSHVWRAKKLPLSKWIPETYNKAGLDLSDGGDETVLAIRNGNRLLKLIPFKFDQPDDTIAFLQEKFIENDLKHPDALIFGDFGGIGAIILKRLKRLGWLNIRFCDNRNKSNQPKVYKNWGAQSWFNLATLIMRDEVLILDDPILIKQLSQRWYKLLDGVVHQLLSKLEMRSRGYPSPDRADATVLAFSDYKSNYVEIPDSHERPMERKEEEKKAIVSEFTLQGYSKGFSGSQPWNRRYNVNNGQKNFDYLQDELADFNKRKRQLKQLTN